MRAAITLGSNIDPEIHLPRAVERIAELARLLAVSSVWQSPPFGYLEQPDFCNAAALVETDLSASQLKSALLLLEEALGRVRDPRNKNGPRTIDLDVALYGDEVISDAEQQIPDPEIPLRPYLAVPLAEVLPHAQHPVLRKSMATLARSCPGAAELIPRPDIKLFGDRFVSPPLQLRVKRT